MAFLTSLAKSLMGTVCNPKTILTPQINSAGQALNTRSQHRRHASRHANPGAYTRLNCKQLEPRCGKKAMARAVCPKRPYNPQRDQCCDQSCKDMLPRFDDLYYKPSDKTQQKYTRTWSECPMIYMYPKEICCYDQIRYPLPEKRTFFRPVIPICPVLEHCRLMFMCRNRMATRCAKLRWPGCRKARDPPSCFEIKKPTDCKRPCTPYPSFSECARDRPPPRPPTECRCHLIEPLCRVAP